MTVAREAATAGEAPMQLWFLVVLENGMRANSGAQVNLTPACV
jgi:hypothetical protein